MHVIQFAYTICFHITYGSLTNIILSSLAFTKARN